MIFRYEAIAGDVEARGTLPASTPAEARQVLRDRGLRVLRLRAIPAASSSNPSLVARILRARRADQRSQLFEDLADMLAVGISLVEALEAGRDSNESSRAARRLFGDLARGQSAGEPLSSLVRRHPSWFDEADAAMLRAGEHAGAIEAVLRLLAGREARSAELRRRVSASLAYPGLVLVLTSVVVVFLSRVTLPRLASMLEEAGVTVPTLTRVLIVTGRALAASAPPLALATPVAILMYSSVARSRVLHGWEAPMRLRRLVPRALRRAALAEAAHELALALRSGVPLAEALRVVAPTVRGPLSGGLRRRVIDAAREVEQGASLFASLSDELWFGPAFRHAIHLGETTGELPDQLSRAAVAEARRANALVDRFAALLQPAAVVVLAFVVGLVILATVQPLVRMQEILH